MAKLIPTLNSSLSEMTGSDRKSNMAKLIPTLNSSLSEMTGGEKRTAQSLEENLEEDYIIWYDVPVGKKNLSNCC